MGTKSQEQMKGGKTSTELYVQLGIIALLALIIVFNAGKIYSSSGTTGIATGIATVSASKIIPTGTPAVYSGEIGVKYDDVSPNNPRLADTTIAKLTQYEDMELNSEQMERYVKI